MKLYWFWSFNPQKARLALEETETPYELIQVDLGKREQKAPEFLALNPRGTVPVLDDDGFVLNESMAIVAYVGEKSGRYWPRDLKARSKALRCLFFVATSLENHVGSVWYNEYVCRRFNLESDPESVERGMKGLARPLRFLEKHLSSSDYMLGDFSLVDCAAGPVLASLAVTRFNWSEYAAVERYLDRLRARPAWDRCGIDLPPI
jgi:glutathione S-transferase